MINLKSFNGFRDYFVSIGYENNSNENFPLELLDFNYNWISKIHLVTNTLDFKIWLFECEELRVENLNLIANRFYKNNRFEKNLLIFVKQNYEETIFLNYTNDGNDKLKIKRLRIPKNKLTKTDIKILADLSIVNKDIIDDFDIANIHQRAFDIEKVTNKFFEEFKVQLNLFAEGIRGTNEAKEYGLILLNRMLFLYFIQQKGWLNGYKNYLYDRFIFSEKNDLNYYDCILKPLFFECLNKPEKSLFNEGRSEEAIRLYTNIVPEILEQEFVPEFNGGIPYLNGGLFEKDKKFEIRNEIQIDNCLFRGLFDNLLNKYNFTVREDLGYDTEIAVDPELLGRIFENMVIEEERKETGSFYTKRYVINHMVKETLKKSAENLITEKDLLEKVKFLIENFENNNLYTDDETNKFKLSSDEAKSVNTFLNELKICDPAVGSGAFLLGLMHILVNIKMKINNSGKQKVSLFKIKREIIQKNLYGIDREHGALEIAKLRLWLSLAVDHEAKDINSIEALPNLSYKLIQGNSLVSFIGNIDLDEYLATKLKYGQGSLFEEKDSVVTLIDELILLKEKFFSATNEKKSILKRIKEIESNLVQELNIDVFNVVDTVYQPKKQFIWRLNFPEVFEQGGFDIIIGNPPYGASFTTEEKTLLKKEYPEVADYESSQYFYLRGLDYLKEDGIIAYITTNSFLYNVYAKKFRKKIIDSFVVEEIYDLTKVDAFDAAKVRTVIIIGKNNSVKNFELNYYEPDLQNLNDNNSAKFILTRIKKKSELIKSDMKWLQLMRFNAEEEAVLDYIVKGAKLLDYYCEVSQGLIPYDKYRGHDEYTIKNRIWHAKEKIDETYKPELKGEDVKRYNVKFNGEKWIQYGPQLAAPREPKYFVEERLLVREILDSTNGSFLAAYTNEEFYNTPSIINIVKKSDVDLFYLLGLLNSKLLAIYNFATSPKAQKGLFPKILVGDVRKIPIKIGIEEQQEYITSRVKQLVKQELVDEKAIKLQSEIDAKVYEIYEINEEQKLLLENLIS